MFEFKCPGCDASHQLPDRVIGRKFRCPTCKAKVKHHPDGRIEIKEIAPEPGAPVPAGSPTSVSLQIENLEDYPVNVSLFSSELLSDGGGSIPSFAVSFECPCWRTKK